MSLQASDDFSIPAETVRVARLSLPKGNVYLRMRDELGVWCHDSDFADLFSRRGQPAAAPWRLALVTIMQFAEGLTDRQTAEAVATRIDWKYVLGLELSAPSFDYSLLSEFRDRILHGQAEQRLLDAMLLRFRELGLLRGRGRQRSDSTHVLAAVRLLNRLELVGETLRHGLEVLAEAAPAWLLQQITEDWFDRYSQRFEQFRLPKSQDERQALAEQIGADGYHLLGAIYAAGAPAELRQLAAVQILRQVWLQQYYREDAQVHWRAAGNLPPGAQMIQSPYDPAARFAQKRTQEWVGYKAHLTETCDEDAPHLIVNVETTVATVPDSNMTATIHAHLAQKDLLPREHLLDAGYVDAGNLTAARQEHAVALVGPVALDTTWQAQTPQGFDIACFRIDWEAQAATCPQGQRSRLWVPGHDRHGNEVIYVRFAQRDCSGCPVRQQCTQAVKGPRGLKLRPRAQHEALQRARQHQTTDAFKATYAKRAGIEGTIALATEPYGLRRTRYLGLAKTHLQNIFIALAINLARVAAWWAGKPRAQTRLMKFTALRSHFRQPDSLLSSAAAT
jgi:transposase